jgi:hypothetical protein
MSEENSPMFREFPVAHQEDYVDEFFEDLLIAHSVLARAMRVMMITVTASVLLVTVALFTPGFLVIKVFIGISGVLSAGLLGIVFGISRDMYWRRFFELFSGAREMFHHGIVSWAAEPQQARQDILDALEEALRRVRGTREGTR